MVCKELCIENQEVEEHSEARDCCFNRRNLGAFSNQAYMCLSRVHFMGVG